ncbi:phosphatidylserine decarboxylase proenzyme 1, mitochondrial isoform X2 [Eurytemora carolleeae]|uniref:phosphatidylserine decarboxylase proenzyme 1, mitochondrial isoform X2 n=1 Tax=Eurytemora carolleeae TaxID=1294199 RepID=UPI000C775C15|nr:phosphatidylserine decarboxylase proenzyme 1, mitochondrial isoform X2 [Eurytemora carolleeae]|eukprot:XP_023335946.1 phosphatidylserine decarboxylase proenzyme 1, mitochondrial-like isoform X2 [Eurytemora affinis]
MNDDLTGITKDEKEEKEENQDIEKTDLDLENQNNSETTGSLESTGSLETTGSLEPTGSLETTGSLESTEDVPWESKLTVRSTLINLYRSLPLRRFSVQFGSLADKPFPQPLAGLLVLLYSRVCGCNLGEANPDSIWEYKSLAQFFARDLKPGSRNISSRSRIVSPADGRITFRGVYAGRLEQIKGVFYSLPKFLGSKSTNPSLQKYLKFCLYQVVIYLCPGDYHGFHSPTSWRLERISHISGELMSVAPGVLQQVPGLLHLNERVVLEGEWRYGYFCMVAVGATSVGSIEITSWPELRTNLLNDKTQKITRRQLNTPTQLEPGQKIGQFRFGSSVVLLFEAPRGLEFIKQAGATLKLGEHLL